MVTNLLMLGAALFVPALVLLWILWLRLAGAQKAEQLQRKNERRHAEQLEWRRTGRLPARYVTTYEPGEMVDEDMARMLELGYQVAEDWLLGDGGRQVIYRFPGIPAL